MGNVMSSKNKVRIGVVGAGGVARDWHLPVLGGNPEWEISWICDLSLEAAKNAVDAYAPKAATFSNLEECCDVDVVLLAIPIGFRQDVIASACKRGWNIFCEKPFALTCAEHNLYIQLAKDSGVQIGVGFMRRFYSPTLTAKKIIQDGLLGRVKSVYASQGTKMIRTGRDSSWYLADRAASGGGVLMETGSHLIDQAFSIVGAKEFKLTAVSQDFHRDLDVETMALSKLRIINGAEIDFNICLSSTRDIWHGMTFIFDHAVIKVGVLPSTPAMLCNSDGVPLVSLSSEGGAFSAPQAFYLEWADFIRQCNTKGLHQSLVNAQNTILTTQFIEDCYDHNNKT